MRASCITTRFGKHEITSNTPFLYPFGKKGQPSRVEVSDVSSDRTVLYLCHVVNRDDVEDTL